MDEKPRIDIGRLAEGERHENESALEPNDPSRILSPTANPAYAVIQHQDLAWIEATQGLQRNLIRALQDYKMTWTERRAVIAHRERVIAEVTEHYVNYLREEAKMATQAAIQARDSILRQELARLRAKLFVELADVTGSAVVEIERLAQSFTSQLVSPAIINAYARFVMKKILALLEQSES